MAREEAWVWRYFKRDRVNNTAICTVEKCETFYTSASEGRTTSMNHHLLRKHGLKEMKQTNSVTSYFAPRKRKFYDRDYTAICIATSGSSYTLADHKKFQDAMLPHQELDYMRKHQLHSTESVANVSHIRKPTAKYVSSTIRRMGSVLQCKLSELLSNDDCYVSISTDSWSGTNKHNYVTISSWIVTSSFQLIRVSPVFDELPIELDSESEYRAIENMLRKLVDGSIRRITNLQIKFTEAVS